MSLNMLEPVKGLDKEPDSLQDLGELNNGVIEEAPGIRAVEETNKVLVIEKLPTLRDFLLPEIEPISHHKFVVLSLFAAAP